MLLFIKTKSNLKFFCYQRMLPPLKNITSSIGFEEQEGLKAQESQELIKVDAKKLIGNSKYPVYLAIDPTNHKRYAMKMFHYKDNRIDEGYKSESRFVNFSHQNIVKMIQAVDHKRTSLKNEVRNSSYILMELAVTDFAALLETTNIFSDEKLLRTYFLQLVKGVDYLHSRGIYHLDLKLQNFLLGFDSNLKISDFDSAFVSSDSFVRSGGSVNYRAPELEKGIQSVPVKADSFSLGISLFVLKLGYMPYNENCKEKTDNLANLLFNNPEEFWSIHEKLNPLVMHLSNEFKILFQKLTRKNPQERLDIKSIRSQKWCQREVYDSEELAEIMKPIIDL